MGIESAIPVDGFLTTQLQKVSDIQKAIDDGKDFTEIAKQYSEDSETSDKGGDLGWFARGMVTKLFVT